MSNTNGVTHDVFISFSTENKDIANQVFDRLHRDGVRVWSFAETAESGSWHLNQLRALRDSKIAIFIITPESDKSPACLDEAQRAADPNQLGTIPVPLVVGAWHHQGSDLWLLLSKWNGVIASPGLTEDNLHRLVGIIHDRLGFRPVASLSTGQALAAVKDDLCSYLEAHPTTSEISIVDKSHELQVKHRGNMVAFAQFTYLDREILATQLIANPEARTAYVIAYLRAFFDQAVAGAHDAVATRLAGHLSLGDTIVISEYSRVLRQAFKVLAETDRRLFLSLRILVISRTGMLLVDDEPKRMADELVSLGASPRMLLFGDWLGYLMHGEDRVEIGQIDTILFGVEAFSVKGEVVYPQIVKELDALRMRGATSHPASRATVIAAGESYKVCRDSSEVTKMIADPHYTVLPEAVIDLIITDIGEFASTKHKKIDLNPCITAVEEAADKIRTQLWPRDEPLPVWNVPDSVARNCIAVATDIDGTLTTNGAISVETLLMIEQLTLSGRRVILVTGRSAGWSAGLAQYVPSIAGVIAENGSVLLLRDGGEVNPVVLDQSAMSASDDLDLLLSDVLKAFPVLNSGTDNFSRLTDRTVEVSSDVSPDKVEQFARQAGFNHTYSTVHHHFTKSRLNKRTGLIEALPLLGLGDVDPRLSIVTIGDSFNDKALFDEGAFAATFGVRGILAHLAKLGSSKPTYVTIADEGRGFNEIATLLLGHSADSIALPGR